MNAYRRVSLKSDELTTESACKVFIVAFGGLRSIPKRSGVVDVQRTEGAMLHPHRTIDEITGFVDNL